MAKNMALNGKGILASLILLLGAVSCQKVETVSVGASVDGNGLRAFQAGFDTKTSVSYNSDANLYAISWRTGDRASIFDGVANNAFTAQSAGSSTTLTGKAAAAATYYALYPYAATAAFSGTRISTSIPSSVSVTADGTADFANISVAKTGDHNLSFSTVAGVLKFTLGASVGNVQEVRIKSVGGESIAGTVFIEMNGKPTLSVVSGVSTIAVTPASGTVFAAGHSYYVAAAPATLSSGVTLEFVTSSGVVSKTQNKVLVINAGQVMNLGTIGDVSPVTDGYAPAGYSLVWSDEFQNGTAPGNNWTFEAGGTGWGNGELQYYCAGGVYSRTGQKTAAVSDGSLKITAYKVTPRGDTNQRSYISARMNTALSWQYGYMEMRARLPLTAGCWPAFWLLPADGPSWVRDESGRGGEIDVMEFVPGEDPNTVHFSAHCYNATGEAGSNSGYVDPVSGIKYPYSNGVSVQNPGEWHCYGLKWTHKDIRGYCDGVQYFYAPNPSPDAEDWYSWPFDQEFYIKLNLAIGGSWGGDPDPDFTEATFEIDWVRVYQ